MSALVQVIGHLLNKWGPGRGLLKEIRPFFISPSHNDNQNLLDITFIFVKCHHRLAVKKIVKYLSYLKQVTYDFSNNKPITEKLINGIW